MSPHQRSQYNSVVKNAVIRLSGSEINVNGVLAEMTRFKQLANACLADDAIPSLPSNKIDWILDFLEERQAGTKVIVASQFTGFLELLSTVLEKKRSGTTCLLERPVTRSAIRSERNSRKKAVIW